MATEASKLTEEEMMRKTMWVKVRAGTNAGKGSGYK
jgi:hypothetical protein